MKGFHAAVEGHVVNILAPVNVNGGVNSDVFSLAEHSHASIIIQVGVSAGTMAITLEECDDFVPTASTAIAFEYYAETTAAGDTLGARTTATTAGITISGNDVIFYVIEIDASELTAGYPALRLVVADPSASVIMGAVAILSGSRYGAEQGNTAIA